MRFAAGAGVGSAMRPARKRRSQLFVVPGLLAAALGEGQGVGEGWKSVCQGTGMRQLLGGKGCSGARGIWDVINALAAC